MTDASTPLPIVLVPGLLASARLYAPQLPELWRRGQVTIADHTRDNEIAAIARRLLAHAPPRFALVGLSMGGYVCFEVLRQAPERVAQVAVLDTTARPDRPEQTARRLEQIELARAGRLDEVADQLLPLFVRSASRSDPELRALVRLMAAETGVAAFERQQQAIIGRADSRPHLGAISCPTLVLVGDGDELTPPELAREIADGVPGAQLVVVPESGHLSTLEQPRRVTAALVDWLESRSREAMNASRARRG